MKPYAALRALFLCLLLSAPFVHADTSDDIKARIEAQQQKIAALEKEIAQYESKLVEIGKNKSTLSSEIARIDTSRKKISSDISVTQDKVKKANLEIERLSGEIGARADRIEHGRLAIQQSLRSLSQADDLTLLEQYYGSSGVDAFWRDTDALVTLQSKIHSTAVALAIEKAALTDTREDVSTQKAQLSSFALQLKGQKVVLDQNRNEHTTLLNQTKQSEAQFQKLLKEKQEARIQFEQELSQFEAQLQYELDPTSLPTTGRGVLAWPLDPEFMARCTTRQSTFKNLFCITQYFGHTEFAQSGAYRGAQHNGIDFGSPTGTKVVAAASGVVEATGNTDVYRGCYSYGKWVLIKHNNGLSTLYAHLSYVSVGQGDAVPIGGLVGYSGKTGYATGPHLHFTLFASDGVRLVKLGDIKAKTNCAQATIPVAPTSAYLDPMTYL